MVVQITAWVGQHSSNGMAGKANPVRSRPTSLARDAACAASGEGETYTNGTALEDSTLPPPHA